MQLFLFCLLNVRLIPNRKIILEGIKKNVSYLCIETMQQRLDHLKLIVKTTKIKQIKKIKIETKLLKEFPAVQEFN